MNETSKLLLQPDLAEALWSVVGLLLLAITVAALVDAWRRRDLAWFIIVLLLPLAGSAAYFLMRSRLREHDRLT